MLAKELRPDEEVVGNPDQGDVTLPVGPEVTLEAIESEFILAVGTSVSKGDLYSPDRFEVFTGIAHRLLRMVDVLIPFPPLWTMEHGSPTVRALIEGRITLKWLARQHDPGVFSKFKEYGRCHLKLLKLHLDAYRDTLVDKCEEIDKQIEYLNVLGWPEQAVEGDENADGWSDAEQALEIGEDVLAKQGSRSDEPGVASHRREEEALGKLTARRT